MAVAIRMPLLSDTMTEGKIIQWNKKVGDKVKSDDVLAEVETDKATMEVVGYEEGTLLYIGVEAGSAAKVNGIIAIVGKEGEDYKSLLEGESKPADTKIENKKHEVEDKASEQKKPSEVSPTGGDLEGAVLPEGAKDIRMPLLSDTMTEGKIIQWNKKVGDKVRSDDVLAEVETDKATMEVVGYEEGTLLYIGVEAGQAAKVNSIIAIVGKEGTDVSAYVAAESKGGKSSAQVNPSKEEKNTQQQEPAQVSPTGGDLEGAGRIKASPLAKKLAVDKGIDISKIKGSADGGRIVKKDVDSYKPGDQSTVNGQQSTEKKSAPQKPIQPFAQTGQEGYTDIPLTQMRKTIARRLSESNFTAPHFFLTMEINMDNAMASRTAINEISPVKISFNDMAIKAAAMALRQHPAVNSSWMPARAGSDGGEFIRQNNHIHIGSAIALPEGLIVPVIRFADQKSLSQIAADAKDLYDKARNKKIQPQDFSGNTFTISNLGMMDIEEFTAIINPPDSAILAIGKIKEVVVKKGEGFGVSNFMKVTLSCDHRSVDGAVGAAFLQTFKKFLENPVTMLV
jgi:pyruvate dehydrogenase E2 component (dihydrolipoamide acetyltransferase)